MNGCVHGAICVRECVSLVNSRALVTGHWLVENKRVYRRVGCRR